MQSPPSESAAILIHFSSPTAPVADPFAAAAAAGGAKTAALETGEGIPCASMLGKREGGAVE
jgi:hypothetical protein